MIGRRRIQNHWGIYTDTGRCIESIVGGIKMNMFDIYENEVMEQLEQIDEAGELTMDEIVRIEWLNQIEREFDEASLALGLDTLQDMSM